MKQMTKEWYKSTVRPILLTLSCSIAIIVANYLNLEEVDGFSVYRGFCYLSLFDGLFYAWGVESEIMVFISIIWLTAIILLYYRIEKMVFLFLKIRSMRRHRR